MVASRTGPALWQNGDTWRYLVKCPSPKQQHVSCYGKGQPHAKVAMMRIARVAATIGLVGSLAGCVAYGGDYGGHGDGYHRSGSSVPQGHMPPPGECRIWYPNRPAGQQPPPGPCHELRFQVPPGARLISG